MNLSSFKRFFEAAAMKKPILLGLKGESKEIIEEFNAGLSFSPDDKLDFKNKLKKIMNRKIYYQLQLGTEKLELVSKEKSLLIRC